MACRPCCILGKGLGCEALFVTFEKLGAELEVVKVK